MAAAPHRLPADEPDHDARERRMGFLDHLDELRTRIIRACAGIAVGMVIAFVKGSPSLDGAGELRLGKRKAGRDDISSSFQYFQRSVGPTSPLNVE